eukprot:snap_masked-scaffold469_size162558-processed-gene-0.22 protein:Tk06433 transcript:snap_masked-scaffold469_size162558-processed-gene-0.22-mRNA-1 annotation:"hypothetical protein DAPPUDRAFT_61547"
MESNVSVVAPGVEAVFFDYCVSGIDFTLPGNGGPACWEFISPWQRACECVFGLGLSLMCLVGGLRRHRPPHSPRMAHPHEYDPLGILGLVALSCVWSMELCYKLATRQAIFMLQPCHVLCLIMMVLLAVPATHSRALTYLFRVHIYFLHGPIMAIVFPVTNTLFLPCEVTTYWGEHLLLMLVPLYLLRRGGVFTMEPTLELAWPLIAYGIWGLYHWGVLEFMSRYTLANLNSMLCPAITDPFYGPYYRWYACGHQFALTLLSGKLFGLLGD